MNFTDYQTSKSLWDAGLNPTRHTYFIDENNAIVCSDDYEVGRTLSGIPCYTLGELIREIEKRNNTFVMITFDSGSYAADSLHEEHDKITEENPNNITPYFSGEGDTPENAAGMLLVEILNERKESGK